VSGNGKSEREREAKSNSHNDDDGVGDDDRKPSTDPEPGGHAKIKEDPLDISRIGGRRGGAAHVGACQRIVWPS
jgi:hypothetical protein